MKAVKKICIVWRAGLGLFWFFRAVLGSTGSSACYACKVFSATYEVVSDTGTVLYTATADEYDRVFLQVVALARDVGCNRAAVGQLDTGYFANGRVGFLWFGGEDLTAHAFDEWSTFQCGDLVDRWTVDFPRPTHRLLQRHAYRCGCGKAPSSRACHCGQP